VPREHPRRPVGDVRLAATIRPGEGVVGD
jgi:hypothetical protein